MPRVSGISVLKEYEKNPNIKPSVIQCIRDWLMQQPHLPGEHITDVDLVLAYHCCEYCIDTTKKVIDLNYTLRTLFDFYQKRAVDDTLEAALRTWLITPLDATTKKGYRVIYCQLLDPDPQKFNYGDAVRAFVMIMDLWLSEEGTAPGTVIILNMDKVALGHLSRVDLNIAQQFFYFLQEAMFVRLKEFHFVNAPGFMDILMSMMRPFMKKELLSMVKVHQVGSSSLEKFFSTDALPREAGGKNKEGTVLRDEIIRKLKDNESFFEEEGKKRTDESKRPSGPITMNAFFSGLDSSFKKLEID